MNDDDLKHREEEEKIHEVVSMNDDDLEHREDEEKRLEETLELQRRIENEAKDCQLKPVADGSDVQEHIRLPMQVGIQT